MSWQERISEQASGREVAEKGKSDRAAEAGNGSADREVILKVKCGNLTCKKEFEKKHKKHRYCSDRCGAAVFGRTRYQKYFKSQGEHGARYVRP